MTTSSTKAVFSVAVELRGHVIDSLTLARVMDLIQAEGCDCQLNDMRVGTSKKDPSTVNITIYAPSQDKLDQVLAQIEPFGALPLGSTPAELIPVESPRLNQRHILEHLFYVRLPQAVCVNGQWLPVMVNLSDLAGQPATRPPEESARHLLVIAVNAEKTKARLALADDLRAGELLVSGQQGLSW